MPDQNDAFAEECPIPANLSGNNGSSIRPQISVSGNNVFVVWEDDAGILYKKSTDGGVHFCAANLLYNDPSAESPDVASFGNNVHVALVSGGQVSVISSTNSGSSFSTPIVLGNGGLSNNAGAPKVAASGDNVYVVWHNQEKILYSRSTDKGTTFENTVLLGDGVASPDIASVGDYVYVVWPVIVDGHSHIYFYRSTDKGATFDFSPPTGADLTPSNYAQIDSEADYSNPAIAAYDSNVHVAWEKTKGDSKTIGILTHTNYGYYSFNYEKIKGPYLDSTGSFTHSSNPSICVVGKSLALAFQDDKYGDNEVFYNKIDLLGPFAYSTENMSSNPGSSTSPDIACSSTKAFVVWQDDSNNNNEIIYYSRTLNSLPTANAGSDQTVIEGATVTLDGSASEDQNMEDSITYSWTQLFGPSVTLSNSGVAKPSFIAPEVTEEALLEFQLIVNDGTVDSEPDIVTITVVAASSFVISSSGTATLAKATSEFDAGSHNISIEINGYYVFEEKLQEQELSILAEGAITSPKGVSITKDSVFGTLILDEDQEFDLDLQKLTFSKDGKTINYSFKIQGEKTGTVTGLLKFENKINFESGGNHESVIGKNQLKAKVGKVTFDTKKSSEGSIIIDNPSVDNTTPIANAGEDQTVEEGELVILDGTESTDEDGDNLTYLWSQIGGSEVELDDDTSEEPTFVAPSVSEEETLTFSLVVNDGLADSEADIVDIIILPTVGNSLSVSHQGTAILQKAKSGFDAGQYDITVEITGDYEIEEGNVNIDKDSLSGNILFAEEEYGLDFTKFTVSKDKKSISYSAKLVGTSNSLAGTIKFASPIDFDNAIAQESLNNKNTLTATIDKVKFDTKKTSTASIEFG